MLQHRLGFQNFNKSPTIWITRQFDAILFSMHWFGNQMVGLVHRTTPHKPTIWIPNYLQSNFKKVGSNVSSIQMVGIQIPTAFRSSNFPNLEEGLSSKSVRLGCPQIPLSPGVLGSRYHLHGLGDLLNVFDRLQTQCNDLEGGHATLLLLERARALCHAKI